MVYTKSFGTAAKVTAAAADSCCPVKRKDDKEAAAAEPKRIEPSGENKITPFAAPRVGAAA